MVHEIFGNLYPGLAEGPIDKESSSVINSIVGDSFLVIGDVVGLIPFINPDTGTQPEDLLPRVGFPPSGFPAYGVIVGGVKKGVHRDADDDIIDKDGTSRGIIAGLFGDSIRICTQGRCLAKIHNVTGSELPIGTPLTPILDFPIIVGDLQKATPGDFVSARLLQTVPLGITTDPRFRVAAVDFQREGKLP